MNIKDFTLLPTPNRKIGYIIRDLPQEFHSLIDESIKTYPINSNKDNLDSLVQSYQMNLEDDKYLKFKEYIIDLGLELDMYLDGRYNDLKISSLWINYQGKYHFNPLHVHGADISFVIWWKVPYKISEEKERFPNANIMNSVGDFWFVYERAEDIGISLLPVDESWERKICVFPASLHHQAFPFYNTDEYRISIAGNLRSK